MSTDVEEHPEQFLDAPDNAVADDGSARPVDIDQAFRDSIRRRDLDYAHQLDLAATLLADLDTAAARCGPHPLWRQHEIAHLARVTGQTRGWAAALLDDAHHVTRHPRLHHAFRTGAISHAQRDRILRGLTELTARTATLHGQSDDPVLGDPVLAGPELLAAEDAFLDATLTAAAAGLTPQALSRRCTRLVIDLTHGWVPTRLPEKGTGTRCDIEPCLDGRTAHLELTLPLPDALRLDAWANAAADAAATHAAQTGTADPRTHQERRAAAVLDALLHGINAPIPTRNEPAEPGSANPPRPHRPASSVVVHLTATADTILGLSQDTAEVAGHGPVDADTARALAAAPGAIWRGIRTDHDGTALAVSPYTYRPTDSVRRFVQARDVTCTTPGCLVPAIDCDLDHVVAFNHHHPASGGPTTPDNLQASCRTHHRLKTFGVLTRPSPPPPTWSDAGPPPF